MQTASDKPTQMPCQAFVGLTKLCTCIASGTKQGLCRRQSALVWKVYIPSLVPRPNPKSRRKGLVSAICACA